MSGRVVRFFPVLIVSCVVTDAVDPVWNCSVPGENSSCNTCSACCKDYLSGPDLQNSCNSCITSDCNFKCSNASCTVCSECCETYIPNGNTCDLCNSLNCRSGNIINRPPEPDTSVWMCKDDRTVCNTCDACCRDYITPEGCGTCVAERCTLKCNGEPTDPQPCNVCPECCRDYIPNGMECDSCVRQKCKTVNNTGWAPPAPSPAPPDMSDGWSCQEETTACRGQNSTCKCNSCGNCCKDYISQGTSCSSCSTQECDFICQEKDDGNGGKLQCNVCPQCCSTFIPNGDSCTRCVKEYCFGQSAITPPVTPAPPPMSDGWLCTNISGECNTCPHCCQGYITPGPSCAQCAQTCQFVCSETPDCTTCPACCKSYITGDDCTLCYKEMCRNDAPDVVPLDAPEPTGAPSVGPSKPGETSPPQSETGSPTNINGTVPTPPPAPVPAPPPETKGSSATLAIILGVVGGVLFCIVLILVVLKMKGVKLVSRHRGAGPRRREQMGKLEDLQMVELEREAALRDGGDDGYYKRSSY